MQKSITRNSVSRNSQDMPVDCEETYYTALDEELKYLIIVILKIQQSGYFKTFDEMLISKGNICFFKISLRAASPTVSAEEDGEKEERRKISTGGDFPSFLLLSVFLRRDSRRGCTQATSRWAQVKS